jgi:hypothetical protein
MSGKVWRNAKIPISKSLRSDLEWLATALEQHTGILLLLANKWLAGACPYHIWCDASFAGLGQWAPCIGRISYTIFNKHKQAHGIYYLETLSVVCAIQLAVDRKWSRVVIHTDSLNTVDLFSSHSPTELLRPLFSYAVLILIRSGLELKVLHVAGRDNVVADAASRQLWEVVAQYAPTAHKIQVYPPTELLGGRTQ